MLTCGEDARVLVWDAPGGKLVGCLEAHRSAVVCMAVWGDTLVTGSVDQTVRVWNLITGTCVAVLDDHTGSVWTAAFTVPFRPGIDDPVPWSEGGTPASIAPLVTGSVDGDLRVWDLSTSGSDAGSLPRCVSVLKGHTDGVWCVAAVRRRHVASVSRDRSLRVWDLDAAECIHVVDRAHVRTPTSVVFIEDGSRAGRIVTGGLDGLVKTWALDPSTLRPRLLHVLGDRESYPVVVGEPLLVPAAQDHDRHMHQRHVPAAAAAAAADSPVIDVLGSSSGSIDSYVEEGTMEFGAGFRRRK
jgi:WD40 repeat protein